MADDNAELKRLEARLAAIRKKKAAGTLGMTEAEIAAKNKKKTKAKPKPKANDTHLGSGLAGKAKTAIAGRRRQIDETVEDAVRGGVREADEDNGVKRK